MNALVLVESFDQQEYGLDMDLHKSILRCFAHQYHNTEKEEQTIVYVTEYITDTILT